jgi:3-oxoacyl-[acyl-carrier-protein] synthase II
MKRRVVVTGLGTINPLGNSVLLSWNRLIKSESGIVKIERFPSDHLPSKIAGLCSPPAPDADRMYSPAVHYALRAADEAIKDSSLQLEGLALESAVSQSDALSLGSLHWIRNR